MEEDGSKVVNHLFQRVVYSECRGAPMGVRDGNPQKMFSVYLVIVANFI